LATELDTFALILTQGLEGVFMARHSMQKKKKKKKKSS